MRIKSSMSAQRNGRKQNETKSYTKPIEMKRYQNSLPRRNETDRNITKSKRNHTKRNENYRNQKSNKIEQNEIKFKMLDINYYDLLKHII